MIDYSILPLKIIGTEVFLEASLEELKVLLALIELGGRAESYDALAEAAGTTRARCRAALTLFTDGGIIKERSADPVVTEEFEERVTRGELIEESSVKVARAIRDSGLCDMLNECARLMKKTALNTAEIKKLTGLHEQYGLSPEYIVFLAANLAANATKISPTTVTNKAISLAEKGITTLEDLEAYIAEEDSERGIIREFKGIIGIYDRNLTEAEKNIFKKWAKKYGYYTNIINFAWNQIGSRYRSNYVKRLDDLITPWFEAGCRTLAECESYYNLYQVEEHIENKAPKKEKKKTEQFSDFDTDEAFMLALERSYGKEK